ncbi:MAG: hypothetical protein A2163_00675 [Actinobacteria bacterium RBG_13_35_12]|nr:MAG: hypothetical protein A2163_00675 [Actinobacteria bacterium RBG_13_35_12]
MASRMTIDELITKQQLDIEFYKQEVAEYSEKISKIQGLIYCIGGPLNDNRLRYSNEQLVIFSKIINIIDL